MAILVDNTPREDGRRSIKAQISDIKDARSELDKQNSILNDSASRYYQDRSTINKNYEDFNNAITTLTDNIKKLSASKKEEDKQAADSMKKFLQSLGLTENKLNKYSNSFDKTIQAFEKMYNEGNATGEEFINTINSMELMQAEMANLNNVISTLAKNSKKLDEKTKKDLKKSYNENYISLGYQSEANEREKAEYLKNQKIANESLFKSFTSEVENLTDNLSQMINTLNINKIAQQVTVSAKQQLQSELQTNYNLNAKQFEQFKHNLYDQIDTSIYTVEEVNNAMATLNTTALGNTQTATKYFNDIIRGQKVLGLSSETQQQLLKLGNLTGRNELAFYQGTVAKFLNSNLGLNKQQLNELVQMNATLANQAADLGIATEAFEKTSMIESSAFEKTNTGYGAKFTQMESTLLANTDTTAALLGMDSGQLSERLARGEQLTDIIRNSNAGSRQALNVLANGTAAEQTRMYEWAKDAWGVDQNTWSVLRLIAQQEADLNKNLQTATQAQSQDTQKAMEEMTDKQTETLTWLQKKLNSATNWINDKIPWAIEATLTSISVGVYAILAAMKLGGNVSEIAKIFGGKKGGSLLKSLFGAGSKLGGASGLSWTSYGNGAIGSLAKTAGWAGIIGGTVAGITDAVAMQGSTGNGAFWDSARGFFLGRGSAEQTNEQKLSSLGGNTAKYTAVGAGIGTLVGGPVGTAVGAGIGALVGLTTGLVGISKENKKLAEEQSKQLDEIETNTATTAYNTKKDNIGIVYRYRGIDNYSSESGSGAIGSIGGGGYHGYLARGPIGAMKDAGKPITSYWGQERTYKDTKGVWHTDKHNGADFYVPEGTPLYSNATGTVTMNFTEKSGANIVGITDSVGYTHLYAHMQSRSPLKVGSEVHKGDFVGYSGQTGNVTGPHLHYTVLKPGEAARKGYWLLNNTIDPGPFVSSSIFNGDASSIISSSNSANASTTDVLGKQATLVQLEKIGGISGPIVNSISDLKQTIIDLSAKTEQNEKILNMLTSRSTPSPTV